MIINLMAQNTNLEPIKKACIDLESEYGVTLDVRNYFTKDVDTDPIILNKMLSDVSDAELLIVRNMFLPKRFLKLDRLENHLKKTKTNTFFHSPNPEINDLYRKYYIGDDREIEVFNKLLRYNTYESEYQLLKHVCNILKIGDFEIITPSECPTDGIYMPEVGIIDDPQSYLDSLNDDQPVVGILFRTHVVENYELSHMDYLVQKMTEKGLQTIPVFFPGKSRKGRELYNSRNVVERYYMDGDRSRVDVILAITPFSMIINSVDKPGITSDPEENFFRSLTDVPVIQAMMVGSDYMDFRDMKAGIRGVNVSGYVAWPEIDGQIISVPLAYTTNQKDKVNQILPIPDRVDHLCELAYNWSKLHRKKPSERKIALLVYQKRFDNGRLASASGLNCLESTVRILNRLKEEGYDVGDIPENGDGLLHEMLSAVTNDFSNLSEKHISENAAGSLSLEKYRSYYDTIDEYNRGCIEEFWGKPPGEICINKGRLIIPGLIKGNVLVGIQPPRAWEDNSERMYHDPIMPPQHQYIAYYQWLRDVFKADAVIHLGTHGSLEWLPGKNAGLSKCCYPDIVLNAIPNIYPYIIDNPGEGVQAKRRSEAVLIGYSGPTMVRSELYDDLELLDTTIRDYLEQKSTMPLRDKNELIDRIDGLIKQTSLVEDLKDRINLENLDESIPVINDYLEDVKDTLISNGLHIFGDKPEESEIVDCVNSTLRVNNNHCRSLRRSIMDALGIVDDIEGVEKAEMLSHTLIEALSDAGFDDSRVSEILSDVLDSDDAEIKNTMHYICTTLVPNIRRMDDEMDSLVHALDGRYIIPGPPGAISRGDVDALPTGRNIYGIDPDMIPSRTAWNNGVKMADAMIERYVDEKGMYPHDIGFVIWATDTMKTGGDDVAYILWLMGVRPIWQENGHIDDLEVVGTEELGRPRIDVSIRITGLFRDSFPNLIRLFNRAVELVADLDESDDENYIRSNLRNDIAEQMSQGLDRIKAEELCRIRVFGGMSGSYGGGVNHAIEAHNWKDVYDLAKIYTSWGGHGFSIQGEEIKMESVFNKMFSRIDVGIKNMPDRQMDVFTGDDVYAYLGGMNALARANGNDDVTLYVGDGSDPERPRIRTASEECRHVFRSKTLNPKFIEGLRKNGFSGVTVIAHLSEYMLGWDATSNTVDDWMYKGLFESYLMDDENREWMMTSNPYSTMEILNNLMEAVERGLWDVDEDTYSEMKKMFLDLESRIEGLDNE